MSLINELESAIGKNILIFLKNGFRYQGPLIKITTDDFIEINDIKSGKKKLISISQIMELEFD